MSSPTSGTRLRQITLKCLRFQTIVTVTTQPYDTVFTFVISSSLIITLYCTNQVDSRGFSLKVYCTSLKVHHGHFMGIFVVFIAFLFKIVVNKCKLSDFPLKKRCSLASSRLLLHLPPRTFYRPFFYRDHCVAVTRYCQ